VAPMSAGRKLYFFLTPTQTPTPRIFLGTRAKSVFGGNFLHQKPNDVVFKARWAFHYFNW